MSRKKSAIVKILEEEGVDDLVRDRARLVRDLRELYREALEWAESGQVPPNMKSFGVTAYGAGNAPLAGTDDPEHYCAWIRTQLLEATDALLPYRYPKPKAVEITGDDGGPVNVNGVVRFVRAAGTD